MHASTTSLEKMRSILECLRQDSPNKFSKEVWESIISLLENHSFEEVCRYLRIQPYYLKRKMRQYKRAQNPEESSLKFQEVFIQNHSDSILIELKSEKGLTAKIQGPVSCLNYLHSLFKE